MDKFIARAKEIWPDIASDLVIIPVHTGVLIAPWKEDWDKAKSIADWWSDDIDVSAFRQERIVLDHRYKRWMIGYGPRSHVLAIRQLDE